METGNWAEWIQALATLISAGVAVVLIKQLSLAKDQLTLAREQLRLGVNWNKLSATFTFFNIETFTDRERVAAEKLSQLNVELYHQKGPLTPNVVESVLKDADYFREVKSFINFLEDYAAAVHTGVMDSEVSYQLMADLVTRYYEIFKPVIEARRDEIGNRRLWIEFEKLALVWEPRRVEEEQRLIKQIEEARQRNERELKEAQEKANQKMLEIITKTGAPSNKYEHP